MKGEVEGPYGELATVDAVRQVMTVKALKAKSDDKVNELAAKDTEIQQLQEQLEAAEERHEAELRHKDEQKNVDMARLQETHEADLHQKDTQLDQQMRTNQQLNTQLRENGVRLREKDERLREKDERLRRREEEFRVELQQKETQLRRKDADISRLQRELQVDMARLQEKHEADLHKKDTQLDPRTNQQLNTQLREEEDETLKENHVRLREKDETLRRREEEFRVELQQKETQLQRKDADISRLQRELQNMQESLERATLQSGAETTGRRPGVKTPLRELKLPLKLKWRRGKNMPFGMSYYPQVVIMEGKAYIGGGEASSDRERQTVMVYDPQQDSFDTLPPYTYRYFSLAVANNQLILVGGFDIQTGKVTNKLGVWNEQSRKWTHPLPPMTTACHSLSVATLNNRWLVVMGGFVDGTALSHVEILDTTESKQWYHAAPLPQPCVSVSAVTIDNTCYLLGGGSTGVASSTVFTVHLDDLITQALSQPAGASAPPTPSPWKSLMDTPEQLSTAFFLNGTLFTTGGSWGGSTMIYHYQPSSKIWIKTGELPAERSRCACTVLPSGELFVTGGDINSEQVDIAIVQ